MRDRLWVRIAALTLLFCAAGVAAVALAGGRLTLEDRIPRVSGNAPRVTAENGRARILDLQWKEDPAGEELLLRITVQGEQAGEEILVLENGEERWDRFLQIGGPFRLTRDLSTGCFSGSDGVLAAAMLYLLLLSLLLWQHFAILKRTALCSWRAALGAGMAFYATVASLQVIWVGLDFFLSPYGSLINVWNQLARAPHSFVQLCWPLMVAEGIALTVSNIALVRHEGGSFRNLLGVWLLAAVAIGTTGAFLLAEYLRPEETGAGWLTEGLRTLYFSGYVLLACLWLGVQLCAFLAARHVPPCDRDVVVILGCRIGEDGKPLPLLRERVERAIAFGSEQEAKSGKPVLFLPSGGKGSDERKSEAAAMAEYLMSRGIPEARILMEDRSTSTLENMKFSARLIRERMPEAKIAFCTTKYHVFRSGILASEAGLKAEGLGSRTRWYFWPNAMIREFIAFLSEKWKAVAAALLGLAAFSVLLAWTAL